MPRHLGNVTHYCTSHRRYNQIGKSSAPPAPDYAAAAKETAAGNLENARLTTKANRVDYNTPYGNLTYSQDPNDQDKWSANVALSPEQQALLTQQNKTSQGLANLQDSATQRVADSLGSEMPGVYDPTQATNNAQELIMSRLQPQMDRSAASLDTQLANQGITVGSDAWKAAKEAQGQQFNDARQQAALQGINLGMQQQGQQFQQGFAARNAPLNELSAIRTGSQVTNPTFGNSAQQQYTGGPDVLDATKSQYAAALGATNAANAASGNFVNGLFGLGGTILGAPSGSIAAGLFSDRRLKSNIRKIGSYKGHNLYEYDKFGRREVGVMAQEVMATRPDAVMLHESGYYMVRYEVL